MKIARARITPYALPLHVPLATAHARLRERRGHLLALESADGLLGWGDASPLAAFGGEDAAVCVRALACTARRLIGSDEGDLDALLATVAAETPVAPAARSALDAALHDLRARHEDRSVASLLAAERGAEPRAWLEVGSLCAGESPSEVESAVRRALAAGHRTIKLKLGAAPLARDLERVGAARSMMHAAHRLRLDANGAWSEDEARRALDGLAAGGGGGGEAELEWIEQPVAADDLAALARLRALGWVRVAADEAVCSAERAEQVIDGGAADVIVLKPAALGGLRPAMRLAERARSAGLEVVVTHLLDSSVGVHAAAALAAALPGERPADGLAAGALFVRDLAPPPPLADGRLWLPEGPGMGVEPAPAAVAACRIGEAVEIAR